MLKLDAIIHGDIKKALSFTSTHERSSKLTLNLLKEQLSLLCLEAWILERVVVDEGAHIWVVDYFSLLLVIFQQSTWKELGKNIYLAELNSWMVVFPTEELEESFLITDTGFDS